MKEWARPGHRDRPVPDGRQGGGLLRQLRRQRGTAAVRDIGEEPVLADLIGGVKTMLDAYEEGIDRQAVPGEQ